MGGQHLLDLARVDGEAGDLDHLGRPVDQVQLAGVVQIADVAGDEPAVGTGAAAAVGPVPGEQGRAADRDPADLAGIRGLGDEVQRVVRVRIGVVGQLPGPSAGFTSLPSGPTIRSSTPASGRPTEPWRGLAVASVLVTTEADSDSP